MKSVIRKIVEKVATEIDPDVEVSIIKIGNSISSPLGRDSMAFEKKTDKKRLLMEVQL